MTLKLHYKKTGDGSKNPMIILHGLFGSGSNWNRLAAKLAAERTVYMVDLRDHGRSPHTDTINYDLMAEDIKDLILTFGLKSTTVLGHSMGGKVAMTLALNNPDCVSELIVVDIAPVNYLNRHQDVIDAMLKLDLSKLENRDDADALLAIENTNMRQFILTNLVRGENSYEWRVNLKLIAESINVICAFPDIKTSYTANTLFIRGGDSDYISKAYEAEIKQLFPNSQIETINNAGHWPHISHPADMLSLLEAVA